MSQITKEMAEHSKKLQEITTIINKEHLTTYPEFVDCISTKYPHLIGPALWNYKDVFIAYMESLERQNAQNLKASHAEKPARKYTGQPRPTRVVNTNVPKKTAKPIPKRAYHPNVKLRETNDGEGKVIRVITNDPNLDDELIKAIIRASQNLD